MPLYSHIVQSHKPGSEGFLLCLFEPVCLIHNSESEYSLISIVFCTGPLLMSPSVFQIIDFFCPFFLHQTQEPKGIWETLMQLPASLLPDSSQNFQNLWSQEWFLITGLIWIIFPFYSPSYKIWQANASTSLYLSSILHTKSESTNLIPSFHFKFPFIPTCNLSLVCHQNLRKTYYSQQQPGCLRRYTLAAPPLMYNSQELYCLH